MTHAQAGVWWSTQVSRCKFRILTAENSVHVLASSDRMEGFMDGDQFVYNRGKRKAQHIAPLHTCRIDAAIPL